jgi:purine-binding chemotaxis protein CheW
MSNLPAQIPGRAVAVDTPLTQQFLTLTLGEELLPCLSNTSVKSSSLGLTEIPLMPPLFRVVTTWWRSGTGGDLAVRFGRERTAIAKRTCIVIVEVEQDEGVQLLGIIVDAVNAVLAVEPSQLEARPTFGARIRTDFIAGILKHGEQFVIVLDIPQVLSLEELAGLVGTLDQAAS